MNRGSGKKKKIGKTREINRSTRMQFTLNPSSLMRGAHRSTRLSRPSHCPHRLHVTPISLPGQLASQSSQLCSLPLGHYLLSDTLRLRVISSKVAVLYLNP